MPIAGLTNWRKGGPHPLATLRDKAIAIQARSVAPCPWHSSPPLSSRQSLRVANRSTLPRNNSSVGFYPYYGLINAGRSGSRKYNPPKVAWAGPRIGGANRRQRLLPKSAANDLRIASLGRNRLGRPPKMPDTRHFLHVCCWRAKGTGWVVVKAVSRKPVSA
jgi:hypothetical protein